MKIAAKILFVGLVTLFLIPALACAPKAGPPTPPAALKPEVIRVGMIGDMTGPYASIVGPMHVAFLDACQYVNEQTGGIAGVRVEAVARDSAGKVDSALAHYMELKAMKPRPVTLSFYVSGEAEACHDRLVEDKWPAMTVASLASVYPRGYTFGVYALYRDATGAWMNWVMQNSPAKNKVAFLTWDTAYGRDIINDEMRAYAKKVGINIVSEELFGIRDTDVSTQLTRIMKLNPDWIYTCTAAHGPGVILKSMAGMGLIGKVKLAGEGVGFAEAVPVIVGDLANGCVVSRSFASLAETDVEGIKWINYYFNLNRRRPTDATGAAQCAFMNVLLTKATVEGALAAAGGDWSKVDGAAIKAQFEKLQNFTALGLTDITYTPERYHPNKVRIFEIKDKKHVPVSGWLPCPTDDTTPMRLR
ncbi:MAG: ABC transporter substrate-binding protein [Chloroflexi bacterium]|nr:ABC transporter substrate-binding protein [Chloroflexota bacterium]